MADEQQLVSWALGFLPAGVNAPVRPALTAVTGDAGFRQYFRLDTSPSLIVAFAPPEHEDNPAFVNKGLALRRAGMHVPSIHAVDFQNGYLLLEDLGDQLLLPLLAGQGMDPFYPVALDTLCRLQRAAVDERLFPHYSAELLNREMALFPDWFVSRLLGHVPGAAEQSLLAETFALLTASALEQPRTLVHRDYHSRNLLWRGEEELGVVDFQDAVAGPITYDLVSLLKDCYIRWPADVVSRRALDYLTRSSLVSDVGETQLLRWFDWMGLQRHIKVLGIFARLWLRDGKPGYLGDLPLVIRYTLEAARQYPELAPFYNWFVDTLLPLLSGQPWYQPWQHAGDER